VPIEDALVEKLKSLTYEPRDLTPEHYAQRRAEELEQFLRFDAQPIEGDPPDPHYALWKAGCSLHTAHYMSPEFGSYHHSMAFFSAVCFYYHDKIKALEAEIAELKGGQV
jgi:hypothetical protein